MTQALNAPVGLNPVEETILKEMPLSVKSGMIVGAGDGRMARAIREKIGPQVDIHLIESRKELHPYLEEERYVHTEPWDESIYQKVGSSSKGIDFIIFNRLQEYWKGNVNLFQKIMHQVKPEGNVWISFYNSASLYEIERILPPVIAGYQRLAGPIDLWAKMDLSSWMAYFGSLGMAIESIGGFLLPEAAKFCKTVKDGQSAEWKAKNYAIKIMDIGDAYLMGAPVIVLKLRSLQAKEKTNVATSFYGVEATPAILQAILFTYETASAKELELFNTALSVAAHTRKDPMEPTALIKYFVSQLDTYKDVKKVLLVGADWGEDLLVLKQLKPDWELTGIERYKEKIEAGRQLLKDSGTKLVHFNEEETLPFKDKEFDLVISLGFFSTLYPPMAEHLSKEMWRVSRQGVAHIEDHRGPAYSMDLKLYPVNKLYESLGGKVELLPIKMDGKPLATYILKAIKV